MNLINNDTQFASLFKESITSDYKAALLFMNVNPDVSLFKFRKILESLCLRYAEHYHYKFNTDNLCEQINELLANDFICGVHKESFHTVRMLTNEGVHNTESNRDVLSRYAVDAREGVLSLLEDAFLNLKLGHKIPEYEMLEPGGQEHKDLWFSCLSSTDHFDHFRLGEFYQALAEAYDKLAIDDESFIIRAYSMYSFAAECYRHAFQLCAKKNIEYVLNSQSDSIKIAEKSHPALFKYALLCLSNRIDSKNENDARLLLHALVKRGFTDAYAYLGWHYYLKGDYRKARHYLTNKKNEQTVFILHKLGILYSEGKACEASSDYAITFFKKAVELGCIESTFELGKLYHQGVIVNQDNELSKQYLQEACVRGSQEATIYLEKHFLRLIDNFLSMLEANVANQTCKQKPYIKTLILSRNEPCTCNSGIKYKKCCGK